MANEVKTPIPARLYNAAVGGHVAGADDIIDDKTGMVVSELVGNKSATSEENPFNGMGVVILPMNIQEVEEDDTTVQKNILTQAMINQTNTKYVIKYDYVLSKDIDVPDNCILEFDGGSVSSINYKIKNTLFSGYIKGLNCDIENSGFVRDTISYTEFGAVMDGVTNDYLAIKACHDFANKFGLKVKQNGGKIVIHNENRIEIKTDTDLSKCSYEVNDDRVLVDTWREYGYGDGEGYIITEDDDNNFVDISDIAKDNMSVFTDGNTWLSPLGTYKESFFVIKSDRVFSKRLGGNYNITNVECFTTNRLGYLIDGALYFNYNDEATKNSISLKVKSIAKNRIEVKLPKVILNQSTNIQPKDNILFVVERNNVDLYLMPDIVTLSYPSGSFVATQNSYIELRNNYGCHIKGGLCDNKGTVYGEDASVTHYVIFANCCSDIKLENCNFYNGWGAVNFSSSKTLTVTNCILNRIDSHCGISNVTIRDTMIYGNNNGINIGYGIGTIFIQNVKWYQCSTSNAPQNTFFYNRADYEYFYRGKIYIDNVTIYKFQNSGSLTIYSQSQVSDTFAGYFTDFGHRELYIKNILIANDYYLGKFVNVTVLALNNAKSYTLSFDKIVLENINLSVYSLSTKTLLNVSGVGNIEIKNFIIRDCNFNGAVFSGSEYSGYAYFIKGLFVENSDISSIPELLQKLESNSKTIINNSYIKNTRLYKSVFPIIFGCVIYTTDSNEMYLGKYTITSCKFIPTDSGQIKLYPLTDKYICDHISYDDGVTFNDSAALSHNVW